MDKVAVENNGGAWLNDRKTIEWHADFKGKVYVKEPGWHWFDLKEQVGDNKPAFQLTLRHLDDEAVKQYCSEISVLTKEQAKEKWGKGGGFDKPKPAYTPGSDMEPSW
jgi:hypothetical protein